MKRSELARLRQSAKASREAASVGLTVLHNSFCDFCVKNWNDWSSSQAAEEKKKIEYKRNLLILHKSSLN